MATGWKRPFDDPIPLPDGRQLATLKEAGEYITSLSKALILVATLSGPTMLARIGVLRALNLQHARDFNPNQKQPHRGRGKLKRD
jgi:hypothetical protein